MALSYINLTNELLRRFRQAEIASADFSSPNPSIHKAAKDAIVNAIDIINNEVDTWPFNASTGVITCVAGQGEYSLESNAKAIDWRSFRLQYDSTLNVNAAPLEFITWDSYNRNYFYRDNEASTADYLAPVYVYRTLANTIGITPLPDEAYSIHYMYYTVPNTLSASTDTTNIPDRFKYVILDTASMEMCDSIEDEEGQIKYYNRSKKGISGMRKQLINDDMDQVITNMSGAARSPNIFNNRYLRL